MKPSEKLWTLIGSIASILLIVFSFNTVYVMYDASQDFTVPVTVTGKYAEGYHHKYSVGEDYYLNCRSETYGGLTIKVNFNTFNTSDKGDRVIFTLDKMDIDRYSRSEDRFVSNLMPIYLVVSLCVFIVLLVILIHYFVDIIKTFNRFIDKTFGS